MLRKANDAPSQAPQPASCRMAIGVTISGGTPTRPGFIIPLQRISARWLDGVATIAAMIIQGQLFTATGGGG